jgi:hypothetical protein
MARACGDWVFHYVGCATTVVGGSTGKTAKTDKSNARLWGWPPFAPSIPL